MTHRRCLPLSFSALLAAGCVGSGETSGEKLSSLDLTQGCAVDSDCQDGHVCRLDQRTCDEAGCSGICVDPPCSRLGEQGCLDRRDCAWQDNPRCESGGECAPFACLPVPTTSTDPCLGLDQATCEERSGCTWFESTNCHEAEGCDVCRSVSTGGDRR
jgi:hypothetical protein